VSNAARASRRAVRIALADVASVADGLTVARVSVTEAE
jgi:hypothetical protein